MERIRKGDEVIVLAGRDKGKRGSVMRVLEDNRALVDNVNLVKKHTKPNPNKGDTGGIIEKEMPIDRSNIKLFNPISEKGDRVGVKALEDGRRVRFFKSNNEVVDV